MLRKYSTLPEGERRDGAIAAMSSPRPITAHTFFARFRRGEVAHHSPWQALLADLELRLDHQQKVSVGCRRAANASEQSEMKGLSPTTMSVPKRPRRDSVRTFVRSWTSTRGSDCSFHASWP